MKKNKCVNVCIKFCDIVKKIYNNDLFFYIVVILFSATIFIHTYGIYILNPVYTDWLLGGDDLTQHYMGWKGYRNGSWMFPIGNTDMLTYPDSVSIIFTDSIPIFAVIFKLLSPVLPEQFQYFGIWGLMCFCLQGIIAGRIMKHFTKSRICMVLAAVLFVMAPVMINRMYAHTALAAHWLILFSIETFIMSYKISDECNDRYIFSKNNVRLYIRWAITGVLCSSIHIYFIPMCGIILLGNCLYILLHQKRIHAPLIMLMSYILLCVMTLWVLGGFSNSGTKAAYGLGTLSFNLNSLYNPQEWYWSKYINPQELYGEYQYEGFAYMGAGCIFSLLCLIPILINNVRLKEFIIGKCKLLLSMGMIILLALICAASPVVTFGNKVIFQYRIPQWLYDLWSIFRSSGRFGWIIVYLCMICSCMVICRYLKNMTSILMLMLVVLIQFSDLFFVFFLKNATFNQRIEHETQLCSEDFWHTVATDNEIDEIIFTNGFYGIPHGQAYDIADLAFDNGKVINSYHVSRGDEDTTALEKSLYELDESDIFIFPPENNSECLKYDMNYYFIDGLIIGCSKKIGDFETIDFVN